MRIALFGINGFIGSEFARQIQERGWEILPISHRYSRHQISYVIENLEKLDIVVNCAAFIPRESVSLCDQNMAETIQGNVLLPAMISNICDRIDIPFAHFSTGCLWNDGLEHSEDDEPQRGFGGYCGTYIGSKLLCEKAVREYHCHYIWRIRLPFDEFDCDRNFLSKLATFSTVWEQNNSCSHRADLVRACLDMIEKRSPWGTYHICNPGFINSAEVVKEMQRRGIIYDHEPEINYGRKDGECRLSVKKLLATGVKIRSVESAIEESLTKWVPRK
jgi:dTDP-4-dehydrorhamnose reductase